MLPIPLTPRALCLTLDFIPVDGILRKSPNQAFEYEQTEKQCEGEICPYENAARQQR
jgi:hypothetical protein